MASNTSITGALNASQLANQISATLRQYSNVSQQQVEELAKTLAKKGARKLKVRRDGQFENRSGDYRKGWRAKRNPNGSWVIHNATDYQLTHLLEKGHDVVNAQGVKVGEARAFPHISEVEEELIREFTDEIVRLFSS